LATLAAAVPSTAAADATCPDRDVAPGADNLDQVAGAMLCEVNRQRLATGLVPLRRARQLDSSARYQAQDMASFRYFAHRRPDGPSLAQRIRATGYFAGVRRALYTENLADAPRARDSAGAVVDAWMQSPEHRADILTAPFRAAGVSVLPVPADAAFYADMPSTLVVVDFGRRYPRHRHRGSSRR
jgi:uncharacterized protein YkwD